MKKRFMAIILCFGMLAGLMTGCTKSTDGAKEETAVKTEDKKEEVKKSSGDLTKLSVFINMPWYQVDSFTGKIPDKIKEITGADLDVTIATDENQLGVIIASGEMPDLIYTDDSGGVLSSLSNPDVCYSLNELTQETGVEFKDSENYNDRNKIAQTFSKDGSAYTLLNSYNTKEQWETMKVGAPGQACIYYRKDLLEGANLKVPTNLNEFYDCLGKLKEAYPDITPFGLGGYWKLQAIANWTGVSADQYNPESGEYKYWSSTESYKDYLKYSNDLYRQGFISVEDYAVENEADGDQMAYNNGCVFYSGYLVRHNMNNLQIHAVDKNAEWAALNPLGEVPIGDNKGWAGVFVSKNCKELKAAATLVSYLNSVEGSRLAVWGIEGDDYTLNDEGVPVFSENYLAIRNDRDKWNKEYNTLFNFGSSAFGEIYGNYSGVDEETLSQFTPYAKGYKNYPEIGIAAPLTTSDEGIIKIKLEELKKKYEAKVIFTDSDEAFESAYNEYMDANKKTGIDKYNEYMTKRIAKVKADLGF